MGWKKKVRLSADERRSASQGAGRHAVNGMMAGAMAGGLAGLAVLPFAPVTAPAGMLAGAMLGLMAGASAGAIDGVRRERRFIRYNSEYGMSPESMPPPTAQVISTNGLYDVALFPGGGRVVGERDDWEQASAPQRYASDDIDYEADRPVSDEKPSQRSSSASSSSSSSSQTRSTSSTTTTTTTTTISSSSAPSRRGGSRDVPDVPQLTEKERKRATKMLEKELEREQKIALKEERRKRKQALKEEKQVKRNASQSKLKPANSAKWDSTYYNKE